MVLHLSLFLGTVVVVSFAVAVDDKSRLVRKEEQAALVGARGELVDTKRHVHTESPLESTLKLGDTSQVSEGSSQKAGEKSGEVDYCAQSYLYGFSGSNDCGNESAVEDPTMCVDAASKLGVEAGRKAQGHPMEMSAATNEVYPQYCFKKWNDPGALFYNPYGVAPNKPWEGTPICTRPKYKTGMNDTNAGGCDGDYEKILDEEDCRTYAACNSICTKDQFTVGEEVENPEGWYIGGLDETCSDTCSKRVGLVCNAKSIAFMKNISSGAKLTDLLNGDKFNTKTLLVAGVKETCSGTVAGSGAFAPYKVTSDSSSSAKGTCGFKGSADPTCEAMSKDDQGTVIPAGDHYKRFCYCSEAYNARPSDTGPEFYDRRPQGCFISPTDGCVYFNVPRPADPAPTADFPLKGQPICQVKLSGRLAVEEEGLTAMTADTQEALAAKAAASSSR